MNTLLDQMTVFGLLAATAISVWLTTQPGSSADAKPGRTQASLGRGLPGHAVIVSAEDLNQRGRRFDIVRYPLEAGAPPELPANQLQNAFNVFLGNRPWLDLYQIRVTGDNGRVVALSPPLRIWSGGSDVTPETAESGESEPASNDKAALALAAHEHFDKSAFSGR